MSAIDDVLMGLQKADEVTKRLTPWWHAIEPLLPLLESGRLTPAQLTEAVERVMLEAKREQIRSGDP